MIFRFFSCVSLVVHFYNIKLERIHQKYILLFLRRQNLSIFKKTILLGNSLIFLPLYRLFRNSLDLNTKRFCEYVWLLHPKTDTSLIFLQLIQINYLFHPVLVQWVHTALQTVFLSCSCSLSCSLHHQLTLMPPQSFCNIAYNSGKKRHMIQP